MNLKPDQLSALSLGYSNMPHKSDEVTLAWESDMPFLNIETNSIPKFAPRHYPHTPEQINKILTIDSNGNIFYLAYKPHRKMNKPLGSMRKDAYLEIRIDKHKYYAHVLAWVLYYNEWPAPGKVVDHINGKPYDNRKENLRCIFSGENKRCMHNSYSKTGYKCVSYHTRLRKYTAYITKDGRYIHIGLYDTPEKAAAAVKSTEKIVFPLLMKEIVT